MLPIEKRIALFDKLGTYMLSDDEAWLLAQQRAYNTNAWFTEENITKAVKNIATEFLQKDKLQQWVAQYQFSTEVKTVGIVMAGNIPLVGFHDFLCVSMSGHKLKMKLSSKDDVLLRHLIEKLTEWEPAYAEQIEISDLLKNCDAYIATGSNNTARYFEAYFGKYPSLIRKNRTSVAVLDGTETEDALNKLANDVFSYFGLGCRNVTQIYVPEGYDFKHLLDVFTQHQDIATYNKYKNNYDYYLAIYLLNKISFLTNDSLLLVENEIPFSAVSVLHYQKYNDKVALLNKLRTNTDIQCIVSNEEIPFGDTQKPSLADYADGVDTMQFLAGL